MMNRKYLKKWIPYIFFLALGCSSCQLRNHYRTPDADWEGLYRDEEMNDTTTLARIPWQEYFTDPYLREMIGEGIENNYDMRIAYTRIRQVEANLSIARGAYFPNVALVGEVTHARTSNGENGKDVFGYHTNQYSLGVAASWEADIWGRLRRQERAQYAYYLNSREYRNLVQSSLVANIATTYYYLLALDEQLRITIETVDLLEESTETIEALQEAGLQNGAAVEQSKGLLYGTMVTIPDLEAQIRETENALSVLLGRKPGPIERSTLGEQSVVVHLEHGVPMQLLTYRPDVRQAELAFRAAFELTNAARAAFYPSVTLGSGSMIGFGANTLSGFFKPENLLLNLVGGITQPLFYQKQLIGNLRLTEAQQEEALLAFEQTVLAAGQEVSDILFSYQLSISKNPIRQEQIEALSTAVYFTQELLKAGEANYTEVLSAEQNLLSAQLNQVSDKLEQLQYGVNLYKALGGGIR